jgi:hypothetical protein
MSFFPAFYGLDPLIYLSRPSLFFLHYRFSFPRLSPVSTCNLLIVLTRFVSSLSPGLIRPCYHFVLLFLCEGRSAFLLSSVRAAAEEIEGGGQPSERLLCISSILLSLTFPACTRGVANVFRL